MFLKNFTVKQILTAIFLVAVLIFSCTKISVAQNKIFNKKFNPPLNLTFPVSCQINKNCWIVNYPDNDLTEKFKDYKNGEITYDGSLGTNIAVKTILDLKKGIPVLSAQDGKVLFTQNNIEDNWESKDKLPNTPPYGNSVIIKHNNGWKTLYCHLKKGSIKVKVGDFTTGGTQIAEMGMSGSSDFPHLNFLVLHDKNFFDPFSGMKLRNEENEEKEEKKGKIEKYKPFWNPAAKEKLTYKNILITNIGVSTESPSIEDIKKGKYENIEILNNVPSIFLWAYGFHFKKNDFLKISLKNPEQEKILDTIVKIKKDRMEHFIFLKKEKPEEMSSKETPAPQEEAWIQGTYEVKIEFIRSNSKIASNYVFYFNIKEPPKPVDEEQLKKEKQLKEARRIRRLNLIIFKKLYEEDKLPEFLKERFKDKDLF